MKLLPRLPSCRLSSMAAAASVVCHPALADCLPNPPASGATVTCTGPAPTSTPVNAPGATDVTLNINADATLSGGGALITLGTGAQINNYGSVQAVNLGSAPNIGILATLNSVVRNFGTMSTTGFNTLTAASVGDNVTLSNELGGQINITGDLSAGLITQGSFNTLQNAGQITMNTFQGGGLFSQIGSFNGLINTGTGVIDTTLNQAFGISAQGGSSNFLFNQGSIVTRGEASHGLFLSENETSTALNTGTITTSGGSSEVLNRAYGIFIAQGRGNSALNLAGGVINASGIGSSGIEVLDSENNQLRNEGTINVSGAGAHGMYVVSGNGNFLQNAGLLNVTGPRGNGLRADDGNTIFINSGTILVQGSDAFGVYMQGSNNTLSNFGTIRATGTNADGVVSNTVSGTFTAFVENASGGSIVSERRYAIRGVNGQETVVNAGLIQSGAGTAIDLRAGNDMLILQTGSQIIGLADGGAGTDITILEGTGTATNDFQNFETLRMSGSDWRFSGNGSFGVTQIQSGMLRVDGTLTSPVEVQAGTALQVGMGGASGTVNGDIANSGTLVFNRSDTVAYSGRVSGAGVLVQQGPGTLVLGGANTYTGGTAIDGGTLAVAADGALGAASGPLAFNGGTLRLDAGFDLAASRAVTLGPGGGTVDTQGFGTKLTQAVSGPGGFTKAGTGTLVLTGASSYAGGTTIAEGTLQLGDGGTSGSLQGMVLNNGALAFNRADAVAFAGTISGSGSLSQLGTGTTLLSAANSYTGGTFLKNGTLAVANSSALGTGPLSMDDGTTLAFAAGGLALANPIALTGRKDPVIDTGAFDATLAGGISGTGELTKAGTGTLVLAAANNTYTGATTVAAGTLRAGSANAFSAASAHTVNAGATLDTAGFAQTVAALANSGTVSVAGSGSARNTLTVSGAYVGGNGVLRLGTSLAGGSAVSDRLVLDGAAATASGRSTIQLTSVVGLGGATGADGIEVVTGQNGASTTAQGTRDAFTLAGGHVDAGPYEYRLYAADAGGAGENWYLRSGTVVQPPAPPPPVAAPGEPPAPPPPRAAPVVVPTYRAEVPLFAALPLQLRQGNLALVGNLHQRVGDEDIASTTPSDAAAAGPRRVWARLVSADIDLQQQGLVAPSSEGRLNGLQTGIDLYTDASWRAGLYLGQMEGSVDVRGFARGLPDTAVGDNDLRNQYLGGYLTYGHASGLYADLVLQAARHRYTVQPLGNPSVEGKGSSGLASIELGRGFEIAPRWTIEPQLQWVYQNLSLDDTALGGATVQQRSGSSWLLRAGVRARGEWGTAAGLLLPYARLNFYRSGGGNDVVRFAGPAASVDIESGADASWGEVAAGFTLALSQVVSLYGEAGQLFDLGSSDAKVRSDLQGSLGLRVRW